MNNNLGCAKNSNDVSETSLHRPFLRTFMSEITCCHEIESEARFFIAMGSFMLSWVTAGHERESVPDSVPTVVLLLAQS